MPLTADPPTMPSRMNLHDLRLVVWVKENLKRAREEPAVGEKHSQFVAGMQFGAREPQVSKWENPKKGGPSGRTLKGVVTYIEKRLKEKAPR